MSSAQGRFMISDPGPYYFTDPQALNQYAYARNNPLKFIDPTGKYFVVSAGDQHFYQKALTELYQRPGGRELVNALAGSDRPILLDRADLDTKNTGTVGISKPLGIAGLNGVQGIHVTMGTDVNVLDAAKMNLGKTGAALTTGHELSHAKAGISEGQSNFSEGVGAMADGDESNAKGRKNTLGGSAQKEAEAIMNQKKDMKRKDAKSTIEEILKSGNKAWQEDSFRVSLCSQNRGACSK
jgi:hypothetical protein